jgi:hypothetical protein
MAPVNYARIGAEQRRRTIIRTMSTHVNDLVVERIMRDEGVSRDVAERRFKGMLQFLDIAAGATASVAPSKPIDTAWHAFILHTAAYTNYCHERFGFFIHHEPAPAGAPSRDDDYLRARRLARERFGDDLDPEIWPSADSRT